MNIEEKSNDWDYCFHYNHNKNSLGEGIREDNGGLKNERNLWQSRMINWKWKHQGMHGEEGEHKNKK